MIIIGITGSIGMGKSTVGAMLESMGVKVHESDKAVHNLLLEGKEGFNAVVAAFPYFEYPKIYGKKNKAGGRDLDRKKLGDFVFQNAQERDKLENILHPLVRKSQDKFIRDQKRLGQDMVALDIPLLFETGAENRVDYVINVSAPFHVQKARVLERSGMTEEKFNAILERQIPDAEKCVRADFVVHTGLGRAQSMKELKEIIVGIKQKP